MNPDMDVDCTVHLKPLQAYYLYAVHGLTDTEVADLPETYVNSMYGAEIRGSDSASKTGLGLMKKMFSGAEREAEEHNILTVAGVAEWSANLKMGKRTFISNEVPYLSTVDALFVKSRSQSDALDGLTRSMLNLGSVAVDRTIVPSYAKEYMTELASETFIKRVCELVNPAVSVKTDQAFMKSFEAGVTNFFHMVSIIKFSTLPSGVAASIERMATNYVRVLGRVHKLEQESLTVS